MKSVQIPYDLFVDLVLYHLNGEDDFDEEIRQGLEQKLDAMALAPDMYLPADLILWFCPPEEVRAFIRFNQEGNQNEWLKRYIDLIQCLQKEGFRLPDDPALNDLMENHSRFSLEELVERYQDRRWFVPYEPNR